MSRILVTGGAGFIGIHLANSFSKQGHKVAIIDNFSNSTKENKNSLHKDITVYKADITDPAIINIFKKEKFEYVSHQAAQIRVQDSIENPGSDAQQNILGTITVLECCRKTNVKKIVFSSSGGAVYGSAKQIPTPETYPPNPQSPYGISKLSCEYYIRFYSEQYGLPFTILRYANVYGPGQRSDAEGGVIAIFVKALLTGGKILIYGKGKQTRDFVYIQDIVSVNNNALFSKKVGMYNVGTGIQTSINQLYKQIQKMGQKRIAVVYKPKRKGEVKKSALAINTIYKDLSWKPEFSLADGLEDMYDYYASR